VSRTRKGQRSRRRRRNRGWFRKGYDPRRRCGFTLEECRKGFRACLAKHPHLAEEWIHYRLKEPRKVAVEVPW